MITREIINKNIIFKDISDPYNNDDVTNEYSFNELSESIDICKNILQKKYGAHAGETALIGAEPGKLQIALIFACIELGITLIIVDYQSSSNWMDGDYIDSKTKALLPITYFLLENNKNGTPKYKFFQKICPKVINFSEEEIDKTPNNQILSNKDTVLIKCTSSGTTGTPKIIEHTHEFMYHLIFRNKHFFDKSVGLIFNLNHGSSIATYFLPAVVSEKVDHIYSIIWTHVSKKITNKINHVMIPYPHYINRFLNENLNFSSELTLYTLSTIKREWIPFVKEKKIKDIISIFGSNETSGPVLINRASDPKFHESKYKAIDDFYNIKLSENGEFLITLPFYNKTINTNDTFKYNNNNYYHMGRSDLIRVNGLAVDTSNYQTIAKNILDCDVIFDSMHNEIYLAIWRNYADINNKVKMIDARLREESKDTHFISNYDVLNYDKFISGVKLDQELLRDYFRNYAEKKY
jgi:acyl-CoA synthetase (AMP-forming)/AMP-acid ligase II